MKIRVNFIGGQKISLVVLLELIIKDESLKPKKVEFKLYPKKIGKYH